MKRIVKVLQRHMFRPILYSSVTKAVIGTAAVLFWLLAVNKNSVAAMRRDAGFLLVSVYLFFWSWIQYLVLDGVKSLQFLQTDMDSELEDDEQAVVKLCSDLICGLVFLGVGLIIS